MRSNKKSVVDERYINISLSVCVDDLLTWPLLLFDLVGYFFLFDLINFWLFWHICEALKYIVWYKQRIRTEKRTQTDKYHILNNEWNNQHGIILKTFDGKKNVYALPPLTIRNSWLIFILFLNTPNYKLLQKCNIKLVCKSVFAQFVCKSLTLYKISNYMLI